MRRKMTLSILGVTIALAATACGGSSSNAAATASDASDASTSSSTRADDASSDTGAIDPCAALSDGQVGQAVGASVTHEGAVGGKCQWVTADTMTYQSVSLRVDDYGTAAGDKNDGRWAYGPETAVSGVGEGARISSGTILVLQFPAGERVCEMQYVNVQKPEDQKAALAVLIPLAKAVRTKLG